MSAAANTTPIVTTVTKTANKEKTQKERDKVNIQNFCEEHYEDILPIIMDKVRRDKRKEVYTRLDFAEMIVADFCTYGLDWHTGNWSFIFIDPGVTVDQKKKSRYHCKVQTSNDTHVITTTSVRGF
ncbi:hypothetical protein Tco_0787325 [Tanacetum coccineum]